MVDEKAIKSADGSTPVIMDPINQSGHNVAISIKRVVPRRWSPKAVLIWAALALWMIYVFVACLIDFRRALPLIFISMKILSVVLLRQLAKCNLRSHFARFLEPAKTAVKDTKRYHWVTYAFVIAFMFALIAFEVRNNLQKMISAFGWATILLVAFAFSTNHRMVRPRVIVWSLAMQLLCAYFVLRLALGQWLFREIAEKVNQFFSYTDLGTSFVYGFIVNPPNICEMGPVFAFKQLSVIVFVSSIISVFYYIGLMQRIVKGFGKVVQLTMGTRPAESACVAGNLFVGMSESPLLVAPYLPMMSRSEICAIMAAGFSTIAGSVYQAYVSFGICGNHILAATLMSAPATFAVSKLLCPEEEEDSESDYEIEIAESEEASAMEAASSGAFKGMILVGAIVANLIVVNALLGFFNDFLLYLGHFVDVPTLSFELIASYLCFPLAFLMSGSTEISELRRIAELIGIKSLLNEFVAYKRLGELSATSQLSLRAQLTATYALCGFANFGSLGIQMGALCVLCPQRRADFGRVALRSLVAGSLATFSTACVAGILMDQINPEDCVLLHSPLANCTRIA